MFEFTPKRIRIVRLSIVLWFFVWLFVRFVRIIFRSELTWFAVPVRFFGNGIQLVSKLRIAQFLLVRFLILELHVTVCQRFPVSVSFVRLQHSSSPDHEASLSTKINQNQKSKVNFLIVF